MATCTRNVYRLSLLMLLGACNTTRIVKPISKGEVQVGFNVGGPLFNLGEIPIVMPLSSAFVAYGYKENTTLFTGLHTTALLFGVIQSDLGFTTKILNQKKFIPAVSLSPIVNGMIDTWEGNGKLFPQLDINAFWQYGNKQYILFCSINNWVDLAPTKAHNESIRTRWLPSIAFGHQWNRSKYTIQLEGKLLLPNQSNQNLVVDYVRYNSMGAVGIYIGINRKF